jgi:hypothetical protein
MATLRGAIVIALAAALGFATPLPSSAGFVVREVGGDSTTASIQATVDLFRADLGDPNNGNAPGPLPSGRREINWDGGGSTATAQAGTPFAGFQGIRGALFTTPGTGFAQVPVGDVDDLFNNATYGVKFSTFSPVRLFTPIGSNIVEVTFFIPAPSGPFTPATVQGFGAVFTDVDLATGAQLEFFGLSNQLLFSDFVTPGTIPNGSLSFLGAVADAGERIARVRITAGNVAPGPNEVGGPEAIDIVLMDDFLYSEPQAVPEPAAVGLLAIGLTALVFRTRRNT